MAVTNFKIKSRNQLPAMVIASPLDYSGTHWTHNGPSANGLKHLQSLALRSHKLLRAMLVAGAKSSDLKVYIRFYPTKLCSFPTNRGFLQLLRIILHDVIFKSSYFA